MELDILKQNTTWNDASASINNNFAKVKTAIEQGGGGGVSTEEVYVGSDEPTDENVKVWIDPTGTPSSPSQPSAGVEVIDNLESESTTAALSANQGRVLKEMIGQGGASGGGSNVFVFPEEVMSDDYNVNNPYFFSDEKTEEFLAAIENPTSVYILYQTDDSDNVLSLPISISLTPMGFTACYMSLTQYAGKTYLGGGLIIFVFSQDGSLGAYTKKVNMEIS